MTVYAVAESVPEGASWPVAGHHYPVMWEKGPWFCIEFEGNPLEYKWKSSPALNGGNWTRIEVPSHPEPERAVVDIGEHPCRHEWYQGQCVHCERPASAYRRIQTEGLAAANTEIERLRGLLIDPGSPEWEDARTILAAELAKSGFNGAAKQVREGEGCNIPSHIALNLIGLAYKQSEVG